MFLFIMLNFNIDLLYLLSVFLFHVKNKSCYNFISKKTNYHLISKYFFFKLPNSFICKKIIPNLNDIKKYDLNLSCLCKFNYRLNYFYLINKINFIRSQHNLKKKLPISIHLKKEQIKIILNIILNSSKITLIKTCCNYTGILIIIIP